VFTEIRKMDTSDPVKLVKAFLPRVPIIGKTALYHTLGLSETSKQRDLRTELTVSLIRSFIVTPSPDPISKTQHISLKDPGIKGRIWVSKVTMPKPEEDSIRQALFKAIEALKEPNAGPGGYKEPELLPVEAEWTGYRAGATSTSPELRIQEELKYTELMKEATSPITVLYFHGGAHCLLDPASHRPTTKKLAKLTKGRCFSVRYRLSPQNPFPAALLDSLVSYFTLLYPAPGSFHGPVKPEHIVFSGDSAGGNLCMALLQTLLELRRQDLKIRWNGEDREVPLPAGVACNSPWMDITHSSPSCETNTKYDYLPARSLNPKGPEFPPCPIWPADPRRRNIYAEDAVLCHPLVSPLAAKSWEGSCPLWIETGQELLSDEDIYVAMKAARQGVKVVFDEFEAMPHCFAIIMQGVECSRKCFDLWSGFIKAAVNDPESIKTHGLRYKAKMLEATEVDVLAMSPFTDEEVITRMKESVKEMSATQPNTLAKL
jgi:acetyl esterase/lipase